MAMAGGLEGGKGAEGRAFHERPYPACSYVIGAGDS